MNDNDTNLSGPEDTAGQIAALQRQVFILLLALIVLSGTVAVYLYYQSRVTGKEIVAIRPQATPVLRAFQERQAAMQTFMKDLIAYSQKDPNFRPVLMKYGVLTAQGTSAAHPAAPKK